jgi:hypothetical protein
LMGRHGGGKSTVRIQAITLIALCLLVVALSGCSSSGSTGNQKAGIDADQFKVLQKARSQTGPLINDASRALNLSYPLATRRQKVAEVIEKYKGKFPKPVFAYSSTHGQIGKVYEHTVTGELMNLKPGIDGDAGLVAGDYLGSVALIYGLEDFEKFIAQHTTDEGSKSNPSDPMPVLEGGASKGFGDGEFRGYVSIATSVDPSSGLISYRLVSNEVTNATLPQIENEFVTQALNRLQEGDDLLLDRTRL